MKSFAVRDLSLSRLVVTVAILLSGISTAYGADPADDLYRQMNAMGIRLGMTIAEARAVVVPQGGDIQLAKPPHQPLTKKVVELGDSRSYFEYLATPIPLQKQQMDPRSRRPKNPVAIKHPDFYINLYVYPKSKGAWDDPDNLVIYALRASRAYGRKKSPFGGPAAVAKMPSVTLEEFLRRMEGNYGSVRELLTGGDKPEFALLPNVKSGKSFSLADIKAAPRDNIQAKQVTSSCAAMGGQAHRAYQYNLKLSLDPKTSSLIKQQGLAGLIGADPRMAPGTFAAWGECGEVSHFQVFLNRQNLSQIEQVNLFRYSRDYCERAMKAFAAGL
jgi:hypothetical protein